VSVSDGRGRPVGDGGLARWLARVAPRSARGDLAIALVCDARMRVLNRNYRRRNYATDVLSFAAKSVEPAGHKADAGKAALKAAADKPLVHRSAKRGGAGPERRVPVLGDLVIATGVAARQARDARHSYHTELRVLALHGLLHLLGYQHDDPNDRRRMAQVEARLRKKGGLSAGLIQRSEGGLQPPATKARLKPAAPSGAATKRPLEPASPHAARRGPRRTAVAAAGSSRPDRESRQAGRSSP